eukprot:11189774-Lingulodinium_polyedra.AAC.1
MLTTKTQHPHPRHGLLPRVAPCGAHRTGHPEEQRNAGTRTGCDMERRRGPQHFGCAPPELTLATTPFRL